MVVVFLATFALYWTTLAPTVVWGDSASLATQAFAGRIDFATAGDHPLFIVIARAFARLPGDAARNVNLVSTLFGALTVMLVFRCGRQLGARTAAAAIGSAALAVSHAFWFHSVIAEVYTANAFFLVVTLTLLLDWRLTRRLRYLCGALLAYGFGLTNHLVLGTMAPAAVVFVVRARGWASTKRALGWVALAIVIVVFASAVFLPEASLRAIRGFWYGPPAIADYFDLGIRPTATLVEAAYYVGYLAYQFPSIALILGIAGATALLRRDRSAAALLLGAWGMNALVFVRHTVWPSATSMKFVFYIPDYVIFSILCAVGAEAILRSGGASAPRRQTICVVALIGAVAALPPLAYALAPAASKRLNVSLVAARSLPYRDNERFFLIPGKRAEFGARRFGEEALQAVQPGAVIFADYTPYAVLRYLQTVERRRPDVLLLSSAPLDPIVRVRSVVSSDGESRPLYVVSADPALYDLTTLGAAFELRPAGPILAVRPSRQDEAGTR